MSGEMQDAQGSRTAAGADPLESKDPAGGDKPRGRPGRKPRGGVPVPVPDLPDQPDPDHVLTWRQRKVLEVIRESVERRGYPPSHARDRRGCRAHQHRPACRTSCPRWRARATCAATPAGRAPSRCGCQGTPRYGQNLRSTTTPRWTSPRRRPAYVPVVGRIAAGGPILAEQAIEDIFPLPRQLVGDGDPVPAQGRRRLDDQRRRSSTATGSSCGSSRSPRTATSSPR